MISWNDLISKMFPSKKLDKLRLITKCAKKFHRHAKIKFYEFGNRKVVESGHQPNFLPHAGTFKKAFLLDFISSLCNISPLFGIYDYNLSTSKWLYQNRIPDINKNGFKKIGFKISKEDMWRRFDTLNKPSEEEWEREIKKIRGHYGNSENLEIIEEEMWKSYELGENFADVNAILLARLCQHLGIKIQFFKYSDVQKEEVFIEEWKELSRNIEKFNRIYNTVISRRNIKDMKYNEQNLAPFWYLCDCGGNVPIYFKSNFKGVCPICGRNHEFDNVEDVFDKLSPRAVFRNLLFSKGLETSIFVSGSGGSLRYGLISNEMYDIFGIRKPITLYWKSKDYYLSKIHEKVLSEISNLLGSELFKIDINDVRDKWAKEIEMRDDEKIRGYYIYSHTLLQIANSIFSKNYSFVDLIASVGINEIAKLWGEALKNAVINENEFLSIQCDVNFGYKEHYSKIKELAEKSKSADPLSLIR